MLSESVVALASTQSEVVDKVDMTTFKELYDEHMGKYKNVYARLAEKHMHEIAEHRRRMCKLKDG